MSLVNMAEDTGDRDSIKFEKLHGNSNWPSWKFNMKLYLIDKDLWSVTESEPALSPEAPSATVSRKVERSLARIGLSLDISQQIHITGCQSGAEAWSKLTSIYDTKDPASQLARRQNFLSMRMTVDESIDSWIARVSYEGAECKTIGCTVEPMDFVSVLLNGLTEHYVPIRRIILSNAAISKKPFDFVDVQQALLNDESAQSVASGDTNTTDFRSQAPNYANVRSTKEAPHRPNLHVVRHTRLTRRIRMLQETRRQTTDL
jgi:hypothetical protein